ncbi:spore coat protein U domain-containing protein [Deinococcus pimensis]|uniref:spore coat protein U domain-containing protein n=1 Tax=Deinococcus pimensis TaxID=309888 RepID=UPI0005EBF2BD|nr:spore coat protein U domain-containing protein [Deinococcus pimensis]
MMLLALLSFASSALAQGASCTLTGRNVGVGAYTWTGPASSAGVAAEVACDLPSGTSVSFRVGIDMLDRRADGRRLLRPLTPGTPLTYDLGLLDGGTRLPWGDGTGGTVTFNRTHTSGEGGLRSSFDGVNVMLEVPAGQMVRADTYTDTVTITLEMLAP